jgi:hypothetical protein
MLRTVVFKLVAAGVAWLVLGAGPCWAQAPAGSGPAPAGPHDPFAKNAMGLEVAGGVLTEAWNSNGTHEWIGAGTFGVNWTFHRGQALVVQFYGAGIDQATPRAAFLNAIVPNVRFRVYTRERWNMFIEVGAGASWSDTTTPPRGTRFNFLLITSTGFMYRLTPQIQAVASARLLHLSNASLMGRDRNPDIEALGGTFGIYFGF